jgi:flagellar FliL protein
MSEKKSEGQAPPKMEGLKKWIVLGAVALVLLGGGTAAGYLVGARNGPPPAPPGTADSAPAAAAVPAAGSVAGKEQIGPMVNIDSFIVNILDDQGSRYLKAAITIEVDGKPGVDEIGIRLPQLRDAILLHVGNKTFQELNDLQGKLQLRAELVTRLNQILQKGKIQKIYFTDFVVQ